MNAHRYVIKIVATTLLAASLPATAQVLGGGAGGGLGGAVNGALGPHGIGGAGGAGGGGYGSIDTTGTLGSMRDRSQQAGSRIRDKATASAEATKNVAVNEGREAAETSPPATPQADRNLSLDGGGDVSAEKRAAGRNISALGSGNAQGSADRSGVQYGGGGQAGVAVRKDEPAASAPEQAPQAEQQ